MSGVTTPCIGARHLPSLRVSHAARSGTQRTHTAPGCPGRCPTAHGAPAVVTGRSKSQDLASRGLRVDMLAGGGLGSREVPARGGPGGRTGVWIPGPARPRSQHGPLVTVSVFCLWGAAHRSSARRAPEQAGPPCCVPATPRIRPPHPAGLRGGASAADPLQLPPWVPRVSGLSSPWHVTGRRVTCSPGHCPGAL